MTNPKIEDKVEKDARIGKVSKDKATILVISLNNQLNPINTTGFDDLGNASRYAKEIINRNGAYAAHICPIMATVKPATSVSVDMPVDNAHLFFPDSSNDTDMKRNIHIRCAAIQDA